MSSARRGSAARRGDRGQAARRRGLGRIFNLAHSAQPTTGSSTNPACFPRHTIEMNHDKIENVDVDESLLGRIFGYGTVLVRGTGGSLEPIYNIGDLLTFRTYITATSNLWLTPFAWYPVRRATLDPALPFTKSHAVDRFALDFGHSPCAAAFTGSTPPLSQAEFRPRKSATWDLRGPSARNPQETWR